MAAPAALGGLGVSVVSAKKQKSCSLNGSGFVSLLRFDSA
jgi:hypothetical protein